MAADTALEEELTDETLEAMLALTGVFFVQIKNGAAGLPNYWYAVDSPKGDSYYFLEGAGPRDGRSKTRLMRDTYQALLGGAKHRLDEP